MARSVCGWLVLSSLFLTAGCADDKDDAPTADEYFYDCENAPPAVKLSKTFATEATFRAIVAKEADGSARMSASRAATLTAPGTGTTLSTTVPPEFLINIPVTAMAPTRAVDPKAALAANRRQRPLASRLRDWLLPVGTAHAQCATDVTGPNVLLRLMHEGEKRPVYTALLSVTTFTPGAEAWRRALKGRTNQTLQLTLMSAWLVNGRVMEGPWVSTQPVDYSVGE